MSRKAFEEFKPGSSVTCIHTATQFVRDMWDQEHFPIVGNEYTVNKKITKEQSFGNCITVLEINSNLPLPFEWFEVI